MVMIVVVVVVCVPMRNRLTVVADRQQRLAITMRGGNAVASQTVLALLKRGRAVPNRCPAVVAAALLAAPRGTIYIHEARGSHQSIDLSSISGTGDKHLRAPPLDGTSSRSVWECVYVSHCVCVYLYVCLVMFFIFF